MVQSRGGVDPRYCEQGMYGRGAYFAEKAQYSNAYAYKLPGQVLPSLGLLKIGSEVIWPDL